VLFAGCLACGSSRTLRVTAIQVGKTLNSDNTVGQSAVSFRPNDTVHVSVLTTGRGSATISVRWTYAGRVLDEPRKQVSYNDFAATDFELQSAGGFPTGEYSVEVFLDGQPVGTKTFRVD
jgi:hypothetical protein